MPTIIKVIKGLILQDPEVLKWYFQNGRIVLDYLYIFFDKTFYVFLYIAMAFTAVYLMMSAAVLLKKKTNYEKEFDPKNAPFVTVQIPTKNEIIALRCAKKCLDFDYPKDKYEIIIGDDSTNSSISLKINEFAEENPGINVVRREEQIGFKPGNLNNILKHSNGEILVIFDSDFTPEKDFLKRIVAPFIDDPSVSAVQAKWNFNNFDQNLVTILASTIVYVFHHITLSFMNLFGTGSLCGSAEAIRKSDLVELGCWVSGSLTEDVEYSLRLHKANKKIVYMPGLQCCSDVPYLASDLYKQQMRWAYGVVTSYKNHLKGLLLNNAASVKQRLLSLCAGFGYLVPILIFALCITGTLSFVTNRPGPIDLPKFFTESIRNILLTSGLIFASIIALCKEKKIKYTLKTLIASFSVGLVTTYYVNKGIFKSIFKKPMDWYLLNKNVNYK